MCKVYREGTISDTLLSPEGTGLSMLYSLARPGSGPKLPQSVAFSLQTGPTVRFSGTSKET